MKKRLDSIQALRGLACLVVFIYHSGIECIATSAVCVFFIISGFTLSYSSCDKAAVCAPGITGSFRFAVKRVRKLYPLYILCMLPIAALDLWALRAASSTVAVTFFIKKLIASLLLVQSWVPNSSIALAFNGVAWFLSTTLFIYFCFPFVLRGLKKIKSRSGLILMMAALAIIQFMLGFAAEPLENILLARGLIPGDGKFAYWFTYIFPVFRLFDFSIGCILGLLFIRRNEHGGRAKAQGFELLSLLLLAVIHYIYYGSDSFLTGEAFRYTQIFVPLSGALVYSFALGEGLLARLFTNRFTLFLGDISSDFFLLHQNIIRLSIMALSTLAVPFSAIKIIIPPSCFVITIIACLMWKKILNTAGKFRLKGNKV